MKVLLDLLHRTWILRSHKNNQLKHKQLHCTQVVNTQLHDRREPNFGICPFGGPSSRSDLRELLMNNLVEAKTRNLGRYRKKYTQIENLTKRTQAHQDLEFLRTIVSRESVHTYIGTLMGPLLNTRVPDLQGQASSNKLFLHDICQCNQQNSSILHNQDCLMHLP